MKVKSFNIEDKGDIKIVNILGHKVTYDLKNNFDRFADDTYNLQMSIFHNRSTRLKTDDGIDLILPINMAHDLAVDLFLIATEYTLTESAESLDQLIKEIADEN